MNSKCKNQYFYLIDEIVDKRTLTNPEISAIIVTHNRPRIFLDCLASLENQSYKNFEIIIVDNGGNDLIRNRILVGNVLYLKMKRNNPILLSKNVGTSFSKAPYVGFIDDDAICHADFILNALKTFGFFPEVSAVRGKILPKSHIIYNKMQSHYNLGEKPLFGYYQEGCSFLKKEEWLNLSYYANKVYDEKLIMGHDGMIVVYGIARKYGAKALLYQPSIIIYHDYATSLRNFLKKKKLHKKAIANYRKFFPEIINFFENEYHPQQATPSVLHRSFIDKVLIRIINFILMIYLRFSSKKYYHRRECIAKL